MASAQPLIDHDEIREWADARGAHPACVKGTGRKKNDTGMIRLDFPGYSGGESLQEISWKEWFRQFDENNLALLVQDATSRGQRSNFNKLVSRKTAGARRTVPRRTVPLRRRAPASSSTRRTASAGQTRSTAAERGTRARRKTASARARRGGRK